MKRNFLKKKKWLLFAFCIIACCFFLKSLWKNTSGAVMMQYVKANRSDLESFSADIIKNNPSDTRTAYHGWDVCYWKDARMVEFQATAFGIGSSTCYCGFYYSPDDSLLGFQGTDVDFIKDGDNWKWEEKQGDNKEYLKKIAKNWYWYKIYF